MKLTISKDILSENLQIVSKAISGRTTLPILECVLLTAREETKLIANDLDVGIETAPIPAEVEEHGSVALDAKMFIEIIRKMPGEMIYISSDENNITFIKSGKSEFKIVGLPGDEFPFLPYIERNGGINLPAVDFKDMIKQTIFSAAVDDSKPILTGELMEIKNETVVLVAVDGFRISYRRLDVPGVADDISVVVPAKSLNELSRIMESGEVSFYVTDKHILFETDKCTLVSRLLEGEFIKYDTIFSEDYRTIIYIDRMTILSALERACLISRDNKRSPVKISVGTETIAITSNTESGHSFDELPADIDGAEMSIAFNPRYLIEALRVIPEDQVALQFTTDLSPCIIRGIDNNTYKYLVLPLRLKG